MFGETEEKRFKQPFKQPKDYPKEFVNKFNEPLPDELSKQEKFGNSPQGELSGESQRMAEAAIERTEQIVAKASLELQRIANEAVAKIRLQNASQKIMDEAVRKVEKDAERATRSLRGIEGRGTEN